MTPEQRVRRYMRTTYNVDLDDLEIAKTPGYWVDKEVKIHKGHPLHSCIGCNEPFKAYYTYYDSRRNLKNGRFLSRTRTWELLKDK